MSLPEFIRTNVEPILVQWETFARGLPLGETMDIAGLRDHAKEMLIVIADDLERPQTRRQQTDKAQGLSDAGSRHAPTAAQAHGAGRAETGFTVESMVAEFRALRASVTHLWTVQRRQATVSDLEDLIRFNEAIDQAIAESIGTYVKEVGHSKDRFLAILGHDLRSPIDAIVTTARFILDSGALEEPHLGLLSRLEKTGRRMNSMVTDLLEFTRTRFGDSIPLTAAPMDASRMVNDVAEEIRSLRDGVVVNVRAEGDTCGVWDEQRLTQAVMNLASNAVHHGTHGTPIDLIVTGRREDVTISVRNQGTPIPAKEIGRIFTAMKDLHAPSGKDRRHLGLGLYIVDKIVRAHGGSIDVESAASGTMFTIHLPRAVAQAG